jgi:hypothetical protein
MLLEQTVLGTHNVDDTTGELVWRPVLLRTGEIALVKENIETIEQKRLVLVLFSLAH